MDDFQPTGTGEPPLAKAGQWLNVEMNGISYKRETNTMPQWAGSCWYYLRYIDPHNDQRPWDKEKENYWMPVDLYVGGVEHAVLHLLYSRFWHKVLYDIGEVSTKEPFQKLVNQGMILGSNGEKMSKSRGNVVNPDDVTEQYGADSLRLYEMFMGPFEAVKPWQTNGIIGVHRFLKRVWKLLIGEQEPESDMLKSGTLSDEAEKQLHKTIQKVSDDIENFRFNTAISAMMEFVNQCYKDNSISKDGAETLTLLLSPFAPHIAEELWQRLGHDDTLAYHPWPQYDPLKILSDLVTMAVMINGKVRGSIEVDKNWNKDMVIEKAKQIESVAKQLAEKTIAKVIFVQHKIVNFVVNS
jgi:leucyl-tRNA synthetase